jgi:hypothetical protein
MPLLGQASGGWTESSSALRILNLGVRNTVGVLTTDSFTQTNPPIVTAPAGTISTTINTQLTGVLSGSVALARPDSGSNFVGGPLEAGVTGTNLATFEVPLGVFINSANGNAYENLPGQASGKGPYVSSQGTYGNQHFETQVQDGTNVVGMATGDALTYIVGAELICSRNGYLMPRLMIDGGGNVRDLDRNLNALESTLAAGNGLGTLIAILKMPADAVQNEIVYDQRI